MGSEPLVVEPTELPIINFEELLEECDAAAREQRRGSIWKNGPLSGNPDEFFVGQDIGDLLDKYANK